MTTLSILATIVGIISGVGNLPQAYKIFKRKSAKDISILTYSIFFIAEVIWFLYGIELKNSPLIISYLFGTICIGLVIIGWFLYGRKK